MTRTEVKPVTERDRSRTTPAAVAALLVAWVGCSGGDEASLPRFADLPSAPQPIQTAARAVVRVRTAGESATGSFVSETGLLLTNNHVLGIPVCAVEGCAVELTFLYQRGETKRTPVNAFAVPVAVDPGLDMALVQISDSRGGPAMSTPDFLTLDPRDPGELLGEHVTIVGHPEGRLKKWTAGQVVDGYGDWITVSAYTLPGNSGSPILDDTGSIVGVVHSAPTGEDLVTDVGVNVSTIGTASKSLMAAMQAPLPSTMISTVASMADPDIVDHAQVFLNAGVATALSGGMTVSVLDRLGAACDAALARQDFRSPDDLYAALAPCSEGEQWIECRSDASPVAYAHVCPAAGEADNWRSRFQAMNQAWVNLNGNTLLLPVSFGVASLAASMDAGKTAGAASLSNALADAHALLDFSVANYLAAFAIASYDGTSILDYARGYRSAPGYQFEARSIASTLGWLAEGGSLSRDDVIGLLEQLYGDPQVNVGTKLYIEEQLYEGGVFK
jgi:hypothetical protein